MLELLEHDNTFFITGITLIVLIIFLVALKPNKKKYIEESDVFDMNDNKAKSELESMLRIMQEDLEIKREKQVITFEQEQEENAIISYHELLKANGREVKEETPPVKPEVPVYKPEVIEFEEEDEGESFKEEPIFHDNIPTNPIIEEKPSTFEESVEEEIVKPYSHERTFKSTEVISPIYGKIDDVNKYHEMYDKLDMNTIKKQPEEIIDIIFEEEEDLYLNDNEIYLNDFTHTLENNQEFLNKLKDFREQLDKL